MRSNFFLLQAISQPKYLLLYSKLCDELIKGDKKNSEKENSTVKSDKKFQSYFLIQLQNEYLNSFNSSEEKQRRDKRQQLALIE
jgi:hypothetical protein